MLRKTINYNAVFRTNFCCPRHKTARPRVVHHAEASAAAAALRHTSHRAHPNVVLIINGCIKIIRPHTSMQHTPLVCQVPLPRPPLWAFHFLIIYADLHFHPTQARNHSLGHNYKTRWWLDYIVLYPHRPSPPHARSSAYIRSKDIWDCVTKNMFKAIIFQFYFFYLLYSCRYVYA